MGGDAQAPGVSEIPALRPDACERVLHLLWPLEQDGNKQGISNGRDKIDPRAWD